MKTKREILHVEPRKEKQQKDRKKLKIISYLLSIQPSHATRYNIMRKAKLPSQEPEEFKQLMNELVFMKWVELQEPTREGGFEEYFISECGKEALNEAKRLVREKHPLSELSVFDDMLDI